VLPALAGTTLTAAVAASGPDKFAVAETLQRSGTCYYRCILASIRYSLRRLGLSQPHVKQLLHVLRRAFLSRVAGDLARVAARGDGLFPSYIQLVRVAAKQVSLSAVKQNRRAGLAAEALAEIVAQVEAVEAAVAALPVLGAGDDRSQWMVRASGAAAAEEGAAAAAAAFDFPGVGVGGASVGVDTLSFEGDASKEPPVAPVSFLGLPRSASDVTSFGDALGALRELRRACELERVNTEEEASVVLLTTASLMEAAFLELLPTPVYGSVGDGSGSDGPGGGGVWRAADAASFVAARDLLVWASAEYTALCGSLVVPDSHPTRVLTHAAIMCAFFQVGSRLQLAAAGGGGGLVVVLVVVVVVLLPISPLSLTTACSSFCLQLCRLPPSDVGRANADSGGGDPGDPGAGAGSGDPHWVLPDLLSRGAAGSGSACYGFPTATVSHEGNRQSLEEVTAAMPLHRPALALARRRILRYCGDMQAGTTHTAFDFGFQINVEGGAKAADASPVLGFVDTFNSTLSRLIERRKQLAKGEEGGCGGGGAKKWERMAKACGDMTASGEPPTKGKVLSQNQRTTDPLNEAQRLVGWLIVPAPAHDSKPDPHLPVSLGTFRLLRDMTCRFLWGIRAGGRGTPPDAGQGGGGGGGGGGSKSGSGANNSAEVYRFEQCYSASFEVQVDDKKQEFGIDPKLCGSLLSGADFGTDYQAGGPADAAFYHPGGGVQTEDDVLHTVALQVGAAGAASVQTRRIPINH
jgi:hypothetical protein